MSELCREDFSILLYLINYSNIMATLKYFIKGKRNPATIYIRLIHGRKIDLTKSTALLIQTEHWNNNKGVVRQIAEFENKLNFQEDLNDLKSKIINNFNKDFADGNYINGDWLENQILLQFDQSKDIDLSFLPEYTKFYIDNLPNKIQKNGSVGLSKSTITKFNSTLKKIKEFEKHKKKRLKIVEVNFKFHKEFIFFLHNIQQLNYNTTGKYLSNVKAICKSAKKDQIKTHPDIESEEFRVPKQETHFITLNTTEIDSIYHHDFRMQAHLNNARNWLIIGLWTGARGNDLLNFKENNIIDGFIQYTSQKTKQKVIIPKHYQVEEILAKEFPYKISMQKYNDYIKEVCKEVGINQIVEGSKSIDISSSKEKKIYRKVHGEFEKWELVSTHIARRSFATNHYGKLPTPVLMAQTGHKTEKMFLKYIGKTPKDDAEVLKEYWEKQMEQNKIRTIINHKFR
jgi:integrase